MSHIFIAIALGIALVAAIRYPMAGAVGILALVIVYYTSTQSGPACPSTSSADPMPLTAPTAVMEQDESFGECSAVEAQAPVEGVPVPMPAGTQSDVVLADDSFDSPGLVDRAVEEHWFSGPKTYKEKQEAELKLHRASRRGQNWSETARWTEEDKAKYERARRKMESEIAAALRPDRYMVVEEVEGEGSATSDQPFASLTSDHHLWHTGHFRNMASGTGDYVQSLTTTI